MKNFTEFLTEAQTSKDYGLTKDFSFKDLGLEGTELLDIADAERGVKSRVSKYKYVLFGQTCLDFAYNENNNKNSNFYRTLRSDCVSGHFGLVYDQKNEIGLISKKVSVIFYNDDSAVAKYVKSLDIKLYTKTTFTKYVEKNGEIELADNECIFKVIESDGLFYGSIDDGRRKMEIDDHISYASSMGWVGRTVSDVCAKALKERGFYILKRANAYLLNNSTNECKKMKFDEYLASRRLDENLNEAVKLKVGDFGTYRDKYGETVGFLVIGCLSHGCIAVTGSLVGMITPKSINKFKIEKYFEASVCIDENGKVEGKYPVSLYNGKFDAFLGMLDGEDDEDDYDDEDLDESLSYAEGKKYLIPLRETRGRRIRLKLVEKETLEGKLENFDEKYVYLGKTRCLPDDYCIDGMSVPWKNIISIEFIKETGTRIF